MFIFMYQHTIQSRNIIVEEDHVLGVKLRLKGLENFQGTGISLWKTKLTKEPKLELPEELLNPSEKTSPSYTEGEL